MIEYIRNGAWGKVVPDSELNDALQYAGIQLTVERRRDGLSNVKINIDDEKILQRWKRYGRKKQKTEAK